MQMTSDVTDNNLTYRVFIIYCLKIIAYCSKNWSMGDFQSPLGAHQMWSI